VKSSISDTTPLMMLMMKPATSIFLPALVFAAAGNADGQRGAIAAGSYLHLFRFASASGGQRSVSFLCSFAQLARTQPKQCLRVFGIKPPGCDVVAEPVRPRDEWGDVGCISQLAVYFTG
jgi:hypothetical protein